MLEKLRTPYIVVRVDGKDRIIILFESILYIEKYHYGVSCDKCDLKMNAASEWCMYRKVDKVSLCNILGTSRSNSIFKKVGKISLFLASFLKGYVRM